jgi:hypothetical protein
MGHTFFTFSLVTQKLHIDLKRECGDEAALYFLPAARSVSLPPK